ncbi:MAG TPA: hypothetical protein VN455_08000 [Methanotrichaceae archaeon]|nr:hypothetical protein [Methanotrichaceae archaeon]
MKQLGVIVPILLLLGLGIASMPAAAELTASQSLDRSAVSVGELVNVIVVLSNNGANISDATITPGYSPGIAIDNPSAQSVVLYPGVMSTVSYPIRAEMSGTFLVSSIISYMDEGMARQLNMVSRLTVTGSQNPAGGMSMNVNSDLNQPPEQAVPGQEQAPGVQGEQTPGIPEHLPGSTRDTFLPGPSGLGPGSVPERNPSGPERIQL